MDTMPEDLRILILQKLDSLEHEVVRIRLDVHALKTHVRWVQAIAGVMFAIALTLGGLMVRV